MYEKNGVLVFDQRQGDRGILAGIRYGISIKSFGKEELSEAETDLASRIDIYDRMRVQDNAILELTVDDAKVAIEAIKRNLEFQERYDTWSHIIGNHDRRALPEIEQFAQAAEV